MDMEELMPDTEVSETGESSAAAGQKDKLSWEEILSDEYYSQCYHKAVQRIIQRRLRQHHEAEDKLERLLTQLKIIAALHGLDTENFDGLEAMLRKQAEEKEKEGEKCLRHLEGLYAQEDEVKESFPDFSLMAALEDEQFLRLSAPHTGLSLMQAYCALNREKIQALGAKESMEAVTKALRSGAMRPGERRDRGRAEPEERSAAMSKAEREALKKRIYEAKAMGKKLGYGG